MVSGRTGSTDYLLKDEMEEEENSIIKSEEISTRRYVTMEEANAFLSVKEETSKIISNGVFLCILSPICFMILGALSERNAYGLTENMAGGIGMIIMLVIVAAAVAIFIYSGSKTAPYEYLEKEVFETEYGVTGMVKERRESFKRIYTRNNIIGVCLCVMALIPLFGGAIVNGENDVFMVSMFSVSLVIVGIGVIFLVRGESSGRVLRNCSRKEITAEGKRNTRAILWLRSCTGLLLQRFILR